MSDDISTAVQREVTRIRNMITETKALLPNGNANFIIYEITLAEADRAIREQDVVALVRLLPVLQLM